MCLYLCFLFGFISICPWGCLFIFFMSLCVFVYFFCLCYGFCVPVFECCQGLSCVYVCLPVCLPLSFSLTPIIFHYVCLCFSFFLYPQFKLLLVKNEMSCNFSLLSILWKKVLPHFNYKPCSFKTDHHWKALYRKYSYILFLSYLWCQKLVKILQSVICLMCSGTQRWAWSMLPESC